MASCDIRLVNDDEFGLRLKSIKENFGKNMDNLREQYFRDVENLVGAHNACDEITHMGEE